MHTNGTKLTASVGSLTASTLLLLAAPTGPTRALHRPPMPSVAVTAEVYPVGPGFCPGTGGAIYWYKISRQLGAAGSGTAGPKTTHQTASPT